MLDMMSLLQKCRTKLENYGCSSARTCHAEKLKRHGLCYFFQGRMLFQKQLDPSQPELVYSRAVKVSTSVLNKSIKEV